MGSFNSAPKILNADTQDDSLTIPPAGLTPVELVQHCRLMRGEERPQLLRRAFLRDPSPYWLSSTDVTDGLRYLSLNNVSKGISIWIESNTNLKKVYQTACSSPSSPANTIRVFQWNILSQCMSFHLIFVVNKLKISPQPPNPPSPPPPAARSTRPRQRQLCAMPRRSPLLGEPQIPDHPGNRAKQSGHCLPAGSRSFQVPADSARHAALRGNLLPQARLTLSVHQREQRTRRLCHFLQEGQTRASRPSHSRPRGLARAEQSGGDCGESARSRHRTRAERLYDTFEGAQRFAVVEIAQRTRQGEYYDTVRSIRPIGDHIFLSHFLRRISCDLPIKSPATDPSWYVATSTPNPLSRCTTRSWPIQRPSCPARTPIWSPPRAWRAVRPRRCWTTRARRAPVRHPVQPNDPRNPIRRPPSAGWTSWPPRSHRSPHGRSAKRAKSVTRLTTCSTHPTGWACRIAWCSRWPARSARIERPASSIRPIIFRCAVTLSWTTTLLQIRLRMLAKGAHLSLAAVRERKRD